MDEARKAWGQKLLLVASLTVVFVLLTVWKTDRSFKVRGAGRSGWRATLQKTDPKLPIVYVLGRLVERRPAIEGIYVSIKTTQNYHLPRIAPSLLTWLQTVNPEQVHIVSDKVPKNDRIYQAASRLGMTFLSTKCAASHSKEALCCKAGEEYLLYYRVTANLTEEQNPFKWFCHFDDDMYANVPNLMSALAMTGNETDDGVYFGRWPGFVVLQRLKKGIKIPEHALHAAGIHQYDKTKLMVKWATGAAYCISASLMEKMHHFFQGNHTYWEYCSKIGLNDDLVPAVLVGYTITDNSQVKSHYDGLNALTVEQLKRVITISHRGKNVVNIPHSPFSVKDDPTRFLSYHCFLYPSTKWCH